MNTKERNFTHVFLQDYDTNENLVYVVSLLPTNVDEREIGFGFNFAQKFNDVEKANEFADKIENILNISFLDFKNDY